MSLQDNGTPGMASDSASPSPGRLDKDVIRVTRELRGLAHDHLELAALETRLTVNTVLRMGIVAIITAIVLVSAWLALLGAAVLGLIDIGLAPAVAMLLLGAANLVLGFAGWQRIRTWSLLLGWPATQRLVKPSAEPETAPEGGVA